VKKLNNAKSQEMTVHVPQKRRQFTYSTAAMPGIQRVATVNILRITVSGLLTFHHHVTVIAEKSAPSPYAPKTILKSTESFDIWITLL